MDISIKDLIVAMERPNGPRGLAPRSAIAGAAAVSGTAFNDLLHSFTPSDKDLRAPERPNEPRRSDAPERPVVPDAPRREAAAAPARETRIPAGTDDAPRSAPSAADDNETAFRHATPRQDGEAFTKPVLPDAALIATTALSAPPAWTPALRASPATAITAAPANEGRPAAPAALPVSGINVAAAVLTEGVAKAAAPAPVVKPAQFADFAPLTAANLDSPLGAEIAALAKAAAVKAQGPDAQPGKAAAVAAPTAPEAARSAAPILPDAPVVMIRDELAPLPAALRGAPAPGMLAAQEVATGTIAGEATATGGAQTTPANGAANGAQATTQAPLPQGAGQGTPGLPSLPALGLAAANAEAPNTGLKPLPTANANGIALPGATPAATGTPPATASQAAARASSLPVPVDEVAVHIARAAANGAHHISIKLSPASLGKVEVKLELTHDGRVAAVVTADNSQTLDMLSRDAKGLERALADAGLKADSGSLQFNLRGEGGNAFGRDTGTGDAHGAGTFPQAAPAAPELPAADLGGYANLRAGIGGVDIRV